MQLIMWLHPTKGRPVFKTDIIKHQLKQPIWNPRHRPGCSANDSGDCIQFKSISGSDMSGILPHKTPASPVKQIRLCYKRSPLYHIHQPGFLLLPRDSMSGRALLKDGHQDCKYNQQYESRYRPVNQPCTFNEMPLNEPPGAKPVETSRSPSVCLSEPRPW